MLDALAEKTCTPCRGSITPLTQEEAARLHVQVAAWELRDDAHRLERKALAEYPGVVSGLCCGASSMRSHDERRWAEDMQISRIRLSDKTSRLHPRHVVPICR